MNFKLTRIKVLKIWIRYTSHFFLDFSSLFVVWIQRHFHYFSTGCIPSYWCCHHLCRPIVVYNPYRKYHPAKRLHQHYTKYNVYIFFYRIKALCVKCQNQGVWNVGSILTSKSNVVSFVMLVLPISFTRCDTDCLKKRWPKCTFQHSFRRLRAESVPKRYFQCPCTIYLPISTFE